MGWHKSEWVFGPSGRLPRLLDGSFDSAGVSGTGGVLRPVAAMLGTGTCTTAIQTPTGTTSNPRGGFSVRCLRDAD